MVTTSILVGGSERVDSTPKKLFENLVLSRYLNTYLESITSFQHFLIEFWDRVNTFPAEIFSKHAKFCIKKDRILNILKACWCSPHVLKDIKPIEFDLKLNVKLKRLTRWTSNVWEFLHFEFLERTIDFTNHYEYTRIWQRTCQS